MEQFQSCEFILYMPILEITFYLNVIYNFKILFYHLEQLVNNHGLSYYKRSVQLYTYIVSDKILIMKMQCKK